MPEIRKILISWFKLESKVSSWICVMTILSVCVYPLVFIGQFDELPLYPPAGYKTYFMKINWYLYPVFFIILFPAIYYTWHKFLEAWQDSNGLTGIVKHLNGDLPDKSLGEKLILEMKSYRKIAIVLAIIASAIFCWEDTSNLRQSYFSADSYSKQIELEKHEPDFFDRWLYSISKPETDLRISPPVTQVAIASICYFLQFNLIALGFLILFQILLQIFFFGIFTSCFKTARMNNLTIYLDHKSNTKDFGLTSFNFALDRMYWTISIGLFIPVISKYSQVNEEHDSGQSMAILWLGVLIASPLLLTIFVRGKWLPACRKIAEEKKELEYFEKQHLWPFNKSRYEKMGMWLCFGIYALYSGKTIFKELLKLII